MFSQLQTLRLYASDAFAAFSNSFFQTSLDFVPIMKAHLELVHGRFERIETLTEHSNVEKRFKEILGKRTPFNSTQDPALRSGSQALRIGPVESKGVRSRTNKSSSAKNCIQVGTSE